MNAIDEKRMQHRMTRRLELCFKNRASNCAAGMRDSNPLCATLAAWPRLHGEQAHSEAVVPACGFRCVRLKVHAFFPAGGDDGLGVSLTLNPNFKAKRPEGRSKNFTGLNVGWNNKYFQTLDVNGTGTVCVRIRCEQDPCWLV